MLAEKSPFRSDSSFHPDYTCATSLFMGSKEASHFQKKLWQIKWQKRAEEMPRVLLGKDEDQIQLNMYKSLKGLSSHGKNIKI